MPEETTETTIDPDEPKGLRKQLAEAHGKIKELQAGNLEAAYTDLGIDTTKGFGKAIAKEYDGVASKDELAGWLKEEYEWEPKAPVETNPAAPVIAQTQAQIDAASEGAGSVPITPTDVESLSKAEADGDYRQTMAIKSNQIASMFDR